MSATFEQVRIVHGVEQLPESEWQRLVHGRPGLRLEVLRAIAANATRPLPLQFFMLEDQDGLAAAAICMPVFRAAAHNPLDSLLFGRAVRAVRALGVSTQPVLAFQIPLMRQSPVVIRAAEASVQQRLLQRLLERIEEHAAELKSGIAFMGVTPEDQPLFAALRGRRYLGSEFETTARLEIQWSDFESYVDHLRQRSRNSAQTARQERNRNRKSAVDIRQVPCTDDVAQALYAITRDHHRQRNSWEPLYGPQFMPQLSRLLGDDLLVFEARRSGQRVAMLAVVRSGTVGWMAWIGMETRDRPNDFTYANMLFYHTADWAPALGLTTLIYGTAAQAAKSRRGCRLLGLYLFYRPHRRVFRMLAAPYFAIHEAWYRRKRR